MILAYSGARESEMPNVVELTKSINTESILRGIFLGPSP